MPTPQKSPDNPAVADRSIVMIGLMGAGKTTIGRNLAERLELPFIDSDEEVEKAAGCTIADIFEVYGEPNFRDCERRVIKRLLEAGPAVIATGGGAYMDADTRAHIAARAVSVWLKADIDVLVMRTAGRADRPLLNSGDPREILEKLIAERYPVYGDADIVIETGNEPTATTVESVCRALENHDEPAGAAP